MAALDHLLGSKESSRDGPALPSDGTVAAARAEGGRLLLREALSREASVAFAEESKREVGPLTAVARSAPPATADSRPRKILPPELEGPVIVDWGSAVCKAGFAGEDAPRAVIPTVAGRPRHPFTMVGMIAKDVLVFIGGEATAKSGILKLIYPVERGMVTDWNYMEKVWHHLFYNELRIAPDDHPILLTEPVLNPKANREKLTMIMFETFQVPALYICVAAVLTLEAEGKRTGVALDSGHEVTSAVPVCEGHVVVHAVAQTGVAGRTITDFISGLLNQRGYLFRPRLNDRELVDHIKEKLGYVALDFEAESKTAAESSELEREYELPDGQRITIHDAHFRGPEVMFRPELDSQPVPLRAPVQNRAVAVHQLLLRAIMSCDDASQEDLSRNIVLSGGNTLFEGFAARVEREVAMLAPPALRRVVKVVAPPQRKDSAWRGGSTFAQHSISFGGETQWMTRREYDEHGPPLVHRKCI